MRVVFLSLSAADWFMWKPPDQTKYVCFHERDDCDITGVDLMMIKDIERDVTDGINRPPLSSSQP